MSSGLHKLRVSELKAHPCTHHVCHVLTLVQALLTERDLPTSGLKQDLIDRLQQVKEIELSTHTWS